MSDFESHIPAGMPIIRLKKMEVKTKANVIIASGHTPMNPIVAKERNVPIAILPFAACHDKIENIAINTRGENANKPLSTLVKIKSMGVRIAWNAGRKFVTIISRPVSVQSPSGI